MTQILDHRGKPVLSAGTRRRVNVRARYDAAEESLHNENHWANADGLSADAANSRGVREKLRKRSRYEVTNNSYARGMSLTLANDCIGTGPRLQMLSSNPDANQRIEKAFAVWAKRVRLAEKLRTLRVAKVQDGEAFCLLTTNSRLGDVTLDLRPIEADQISTPDLNFDEEFAVDGIKFDKEWNPLEYHLLKSHPGDTRGRLAGFLEYDRIDAANMIHLFRSDRPGQHRGVPEILAALPLFAQLRRFTLATISAAETAASFAAVIQSNSNPDPDDLDDIAALDTVELERNMATTLPRGWQIGQVRSEHPATTYLMFRDAILNEIARCLNMPFNVAAGNSSGYNYASGRLDHQTYDRSIRVEQNYWECTALEVIFTAWFDEAALQGLMPSAAELDTLHHQWFWDGKGHVDPQKEATAQETKLANFTTTLADEFAKEGKDWETQLRQRATELKLMGELGLTQAAAPEPTEDDTADEAEEATV